MAASTTPARRAPSLQRRLGVLVVAFAGLLAVTAGFSAFAVRRWTDALDQRRGARAALIDVAALQAADVEQKAAVAEYLLVGDAAALDRYEAAVRQAEALRVELDDNPALEPQRADVAALADDGARWRAEVAEPSIERRRRGEPPDATVLAHGVALGDAGRAAFVRLADALRDRSVTLDRQAAAVQRVALAGLAAAFTAALGAVASAVVLFRRWVTQPLGEMAGAARAIGRGDAVELPAAATAELGDLTTAVDFLQRSLSDARDRAVRAYAALEQSAVLALQVRSELADQHGDAPDGWEVASAMRAAEGMVAGDCYDVGLVTPTSLYVVMIDVTGHGAVAALHALKAKSQLRSAVKSGLDPGSAVGWLARHHGGADEGDEFLTAFVAVFDLRTGICSFANAGHPPALLVGPDGVAELAATGPLVGPFDATWRTDRIEVPPGATVVMYTDGVTEALGPDRDRLGEERLRDLLVETADGDVRAVDAHAMVDRVVALVDGYRVGTLTDDMSVVVLRRDHANADR